MRAANLCFPPNRRGGHRAVDPFRQLLCLVGTQFVAESRHLRRHAPFADDLDRLRPAQAFEAFRQQRRADATKPGFAMTGDTVFAIQARHIGGASLQRHAGQAGGQGKAGNAQMPVHQALRSLM
ncbi:MAG: hypothetical protein AW09_001842 [Candidatus Accumulibacter phosphatis]|uniref:Uncharacterized protein n=1 Tax=Candidatus Accumulibacter phosphatis TaxID=327160 RepID=A0A080LW80_9PROT|nr:MAG: hypothetical protein AW09_001842 [Candidatus Accumulibacter phosphatis]